MSTKSPGGPQKCQLILQRCLAIQLTKPGHTPEDFWMYDSGYMIFQNFLAANSQCWWNSPLTAATRALKYAGHIAPGMLLVTAEPCALEVLRGAYARSVLKPPATYVITSVGDIDDCILTPTIQGQFTPLPEALCDIIMDLTQHGQSATIENLRIKLQLRFPHMTTPSTEVIYDTLAQLMQEGKIYQTSKGYFIVTPERRRSRSKPRTNKLVTNNCTYEEYEEDAEQTQIQPRTLLMTPSEALNSLYGEILTERDGDRTHQCIQTNLADVICGGNPNDKIIYPRSSKRRSASFPTPRSLERRHSLRLFSSSKRLQRCASTRSLSKTYALSLATDSSSSEYQSTDSSSPKKRSLLSRLFRRSGRSKQRTTETYSAQFPPPEWFNSKAVHLHSVGTQTNDHDLPIAHSLSNSTFYDGSDLSQRSLTLPRRHHRRHMSSESTFLISSRECSPIRRRSPGYGSSSLPRSTQSIPTSSSALRQLNKAHARKSVIGKHLLEEQNHHHQQQQQQQQQHRMNMKNSGSNYVDNSILYRSSLPSGPSSLESGKASTALFTSGPSSIDSCGKSSFSKTSGHSSLDSANTTMIQPSPTRSILYAPHYQHLKSEQKTAQNQQQQQQQQQMNLISSKPPTGITTSNSNSSITLQVTTNQNNLPSTKIFVQNSPIHSVITLENGKLRDNQNVYIINNETTTNDKGTIISKTLSQRHSNPTLLKTNSTTTIQSNSKENSINENDANSETCDSISCISEQSPNDLLSSSELLDTFKFTKNINSDATMNNNRNLLVTNNASDNIVLNNCLKHNNDLLKSTAIDSTSNNIDFHLAGSVGNLDYYKKSHNKLNSNCDLKNIHCESGGNLCKNDINVTVNGDAIAHILKKNITAVSSEPNLAIKNVEIKSPNTLFYNGNDKSIEKENLNRRLSLSKDFREELYNFPSLTDLSFNFTSLAAQKILQGVSLNSIDTLVELNLANGKEKKQQNVNINSTFDSNKTAVIDFEAA